MTGPAPVTRRRNRPGSAERRPWALYLSPVFKTASPRGPHVAVSIGPDLLARITPYRARKLADRLHDLADQLERKTP